MYHICSCSIVNGKKCSEESTEKTIGERHLGASLRVENVFECKSDDDWNGTEGTQGML